MEGHIFPNPVDTESYMVMLCYKNGSLAREGNILISADSRKVLVSKVDFIEYETYPWQIYAIIMLKSLGMFSTNICSKLLHLMVSKSVKQ